MFKKNDGKTPPYLMGFRRALYKGAGFAGRSLNRPLIGVVNSWGEISPATKHLNKITSSVKYGIQSAGGTPVEFVISGLCDGTCAGARIANTYNMAWRDITAAYIEAVAHANQFDGLVFISVCDEVVPAHLMAAVRLNLPSIMVSGGTMVHGRVNNREIWAGSVTEAYAALQKGDIDQDTYWAIENNSCMGSGACGVMGTGNTMQAFAEAIGFTLPGNAVIAGVDPRLERQAYVSGARAVGLVTDGLTPDRIINQESLENAIRVCLAIGGSTNVVLHALSLAQDADLKLTLGDFDRWSRETPFICDIQPSGKYPVLQLDRAGGIPAVMRELAPLLHKDKLTVTGKKIQDIISNCRNLDEKVIRSLSAPLESQGGIAVLHGNLAPDGAVIKQSACAAQKFRGRAVVFDDEETACQAIIQETVQPGNVVVIRGMGPRGGPGLPCLYSSLWLLKSRGLDDKVAIITDGRLSGTIRGIAVAHVAPEAVVGGSLAIVKDGDYITIDIVNRTLDLELAEQDIENRKKEWKAPEVKQFKGFMSIYANNVQPTNKGAYLSVQPQGDKKNKLK